MKERLGAVGRSIQDAYMWVEDKPLMIVLAAAGATVSAILVLASSAGWERGHASPAVTLPSLLLVPAVAVFLYVTSPSRARRLGRTRRTGWFRSSFANAVRGATTTRALVTSPRAHGVGVLGQVVYWAGDILCLWAALQLVHAHISVAALVLGYSGGYVLTRRALPAGGSGIVEVALTLALVGMGLHFARALLGVIVYRLFNFWLPIIPALALMPAVKELRGRFQRVEKAA